MLLGVGVCGYAAPAPDAKSEAVEKSRKDRVPMPAGWSPEDQVKAEEEAKKAYPFVKDVLMEDLPLRQQRLREMGLGLKDVKHSYMLLDSPYVDTYERKYGPVRFMHAKHAAALDGDCAACHHFRPADEKSPEAVACRACHQDNRQENGKERIGLKAAYHMQCMNCHEKMKKGPVSCEGCHDKRPVDHKELVKLPENPTPQQVTRECLRCHEQAGEDMLTTAHWLWRGPSPYTVEHRKSVMSGKGTTTLNNFCLSAISNEKRCTSCHAGYGWKDDTFDFSNQENMDCLVCHDTTGSYKKAPPAAGMPDPKVDMVYVAKNVGPTSRKTCGVCHFSGGGGDAVKHADMSAQLYWPDRNCDVHMGGYDFQCVECHKTRNHKISGRSTSVPVAEGSRACEDCHTSKPHYGDSLLDHHLNKHCETVACNTCHSPIYSKCAATKTWWDWSTAGDKQREVHKDKYGKPDYNWMKGDFRWKEASQPVYEWFNGFMERRLLGDLIEPEAKGFRPGEHPTPAQKAAMTVTDITRPVGSFGDPRSKITPFKIMAGIQPADAEYRYLLVPHLFPYGKDDVSAFWKGTDWQSAFKEGMAKAGLPYSGKYMWVATNMYWRIEHEVMPKEHALSCAQCHDSLKGEKTCDRCHQDARDGRFRELTEKGADFELLRMMGRDVGDLIGKTDYIDFKKLGYKGDPILYGGRFTRLPLGQRPEKR
ncbi:tetrathionate reductase family octaheme c-type cytochrome [Desulfovibrio sp. Huiquan2017]|uniref:tetrathionate reductase family octaheme c-type cytochrome n=1 Tax=Desulfovibrio sp. Huiquan2017 TaxID=2816861 RepID=UPI002570632D|nr:tetrathionate reductase family octaheme c-type cytochrome [Desulfovibrio sp. Huiquan2017]